MMNRLVVILFALSLVAMPLRLFAPEVCDCSTESHMVASGDEQVETSSCCNSESGRSTEDGSPQDPDEPCNNCECPMQCCGISQTLVALPAIVKGAMPRLASERIGYTTQVDCGSLHTSRLKRPPRYLTLAA